MQMLWRFAIVMAISTTLSVLVGLAVLPPNEPLMAFLMGYSVTLTTIYWFSPWIYEEWP